MFKSLYDRLIALSQSPRAPYALAAIAFAESSVFPIPPDVILAPMSLASPETRLALRADLRRSPRCSAACVGYGIGALLFDTLGQWLIHVYGYADRMAALKETYAKWGALVILVKGLTPIPFKLVTIVSGLLGYNFPLFVLLCLITRGGRFFLLAGRAQSFRRSVAAARCERHFAAFLALIGGEHRRRILSRRARALSRGPRELTSPVMTETSARSA